MPPKRKTASKKPVDDPPASTPASTSRKQKEIVLDSDNETGDIANVTTTAAVNTAAAIATAASVNHQTAIAAPRDNVLFGTSTTSSFEPLLPSEEDDAPPANSFPACFTTADIQCAQLASQSQLVKRWCTVYYIHYGDTSLQQFSHNLYLPITVNAIFTPDPQIKRESNMVSRSELLGQLRAADNGIAEIAAYGVMPVDSIRSTLPFPSQILWCGLKLGFPYVPVTEHSFRVNDRLAYFVRLVVRRTTFGVESTSLSSSSSSLLQLSKSKKEKKTVATLQDVFDRLDIWNHYANTTDDNGKTRTVDEIVDQVKYSHVTHYSDVAIVQYLKEKYPDEDELKSHMTDPVEPIKQIVKSLKFTNEPKRPVAAKDSKKRRKVDNDNEQ